LNKETNRVNNDDETNDTNDNGNRIIAAQPETERQELLRLRLELARGQQRLEAERLEAERLLQEQVRLLQLQHGLMLNIQDDADARMVAAATRRQLPQIRAFVTHVTTERQHQQAESVEGDAEENADTVSSPIVKSNP